MSTYELAQMLTIALPHATPRPHWELIIIIYTHVRRRREEEKKTAKKGKVGAEETFEAYALDDSSIEKDASNHRKLEGWPMVFAVLSLIAILVGSAIEIVPSL